MRVCSRLLIGLATASLLLQAGHVAFGLGGSTLGGLNDDLIAVTMVASVLATLAASRARPDWRGVWLTVGVGALLYAAGEINFFYLQKSLDQFPTVSDLLWLSYYPLVLAAAWSYIRGSHPLRSAIWLDAAIFSLIVASLGYEFFLEGPVNQASHSPVVTGQLLYPILDLLFIALALVLGYSARWRLGPAFLVISAASLVLFVTDTVNLSRIASNSYVPGTLLDVGWPATLLLMAIASQLPLRAPRFQPLRGWRFNVMIALSLAIAAALLILETDKVPALVITGVLVIALAAIRLMLSLHENKRLAEDNSEIVSTAGEGILRSNSEGRITFANPAACQMLGYGPEQIMGERAHELFHHSRVEGIPYPLEECPIQAVVTGNAPRRVTDEVFWRRDGSSFPVDYTAAPLRQDGDTVGAVVVFDDVTAQRNLEERLRYQADHDPLTGLLNRRQFVEEVDAQIRHSRRYGRGAAVMLLDLDSFKFVNDSFGHAAGDAAIQSVARLIGKRMRGTDAIGRLGGDEFAVLLREVTPDDALQATNSVLSSIKTNTDPALDASAGIVTFDGTDGLEADELIIGADIALYQAKQRGGHTAVRWDGSRSTRLAWVEEIRKALREGRFALYTQPILDLHTGEVTREEVLLRLIDRHGDVIPPAAFLPTAERFGLIREIDRMVLAEAIELARGGRRLSVNVSGRTLADDKLLRAISSAVTDGLDPDALAFEITETSAVANLQEARSFAAHLERLGCRIALDDFGTGFSSLSYLKHIPVHALKIDREFISGLTENTLDQYMVRMIVGIAQRLGQITIAEGVEDAATLAMLQSVGVDCAQGFFIGRPAPVESPAAEPPQAVREVLEATAASC